ncbi:MAG: sulfatase-like hydrolase/transferase [Lachnospiraceae bacterium]|nr:sulfatase-like hydrolase/transferase [Lachnospiraceae bacterium]
MDTGKEKLKALWRDKRSWKIRLPLAALCAFSCVFTFLIFGPCEIYAQNVQELSFSFSALLQVLLGAGALVFAALFGLLLLLRGKIFNFVVSFLFAVTLAGYLQGNFWNTDHGALTGDAVNWLNYKVPMLLNGAVWLGVFAAVLLLLYFSRRIWTMGIELVCVVLIGAQMVALVSLTAGSGSGQLWKAGREKEALTRDGIYEVSGKKNVIVFLLDRLDNQYMDAALEKYPELEEGLDGFTYYHDFTGSYANTRPSIAYLLTGVQHDYSVSWKDYFHRAWTEPVYTLLPDIHEAGYRTKVYTDCGYVFGEPQDVSGFVDNVRKISEKKVRRAPLLEKMLDLSFYRYAPESMKPYFQISTSDLNGIAVSEDDSGEDQLFAVDDAVFWGGYRENGLTVEDEGNGSFIFYHLNGAHDPFTIDADAEPAAGSTREEQIVGNFRMIFRYMEELKEKGLYEDATIIITADHGRPPKPTGDLSGISESRVSTLMIKPAGKGAEGPMKISNKQVCQDNLRASIAGYFGLETGEYGRTVESIGEHEQMTRTLWMRTEGKGEKRLYTFEITGDANDFANWKVVGEIKMEYTGI